MLQNIDSHNNSSSSYDSSWNTNFPADKALLFSFTIVPAYAIIFLIGFIANIFVIVVIVKYRRMRTLTNRFLLNLAISDLLATLICIPTNAYYVLDKRWIFGEFLCRFVPFIQVRQESSEELMVATYFMYDVHILGTSVAVSIFTLMAVSVDRFIAIHRPMHSKLLCTSTRVFVIISLIWIASLLLMIPLIVHHRIVDPLDTTFPACTEDWLQNMNARLVYDFILLFVLFIIPLTLMTYCYIRISLSLWFIDSKTHQQMSSSSITTTNAAHFSSTSDEFPHMDINDVRRPVAQKGRPYYIHYYKMHENDVRRRQCEKDRDHMDESSLLKNSYGRNSANNRSVRCAGQDNVKSKSLSITPTATTTMAATTPLIHAIYRRSSSLVGRRFGENSYTSHHLNQIQLGRQTSKHQHNSTSSRPSGTLRSSLTSSQSQNRLLGLNTRPANGNKNNSNNNNNNNANNNVRRSIVDAERASRFLRSRRRVVKLLITLVVVFFITRLPANILSIYIDITSNTYLPQNMFLNETEPTIQIDETNTDKRMILVLYINPLVQLLSLSNSLFNPLCYCVMSHAIKIIVTVVRQKLRRRKQNKAPAIPLRQRPVVRNQSIQKMLPQRNSFENNIAIR